MKRRGLIFIISLLIVLGLFLFFPKAAGREYFFSSVWKREIPPQTVTGYTADSKVFPFSDGNLFGYITEDAAVTGIEPIVFDVTSSSKYFINYSSVSENLLVKNAQGDIISTISVPGYPYIKSERLFIFDIDGCGFSEWTFEGDRKWGKRFTSVVTSFDCNTNDTIVGLINGEILLYDDKGDYLYRDQPAGSRVQIVYGTAVSSKGTFFAVIIGIDPQRIIVFQSREEGYVPIYSKEITDTFRREIFLDFSANETYLFYEQNENICRLDIQKKKEKRFPINGKPLAIDFIEGIRTLYIHSGFHDRSTIDVFSEGGMLLNRFYAAPLSSVHINEKSIYFQRNGFLNRVDVRGVNQ